MIDSRERVARVFCGKIPDRVPFFPTIFTDHACHASGLHFKDVLINPRLGPGCMLKAALRYRTDAVRFTIGAGNEWFRSKTVRDSDGELVQFDIASGKAEGFFDVNGGGLFVPYNPPLPVTTVSEARDLPFLTALEYIDGGFLDDVKATVLSARSHGLFTVGMVGGQAISYMVDKLGGAESALLCFYDDPVLAKALIEKSVAVSIEKVRAFVECGVDCIYIGDSYASGSVISPEIYEEFCLPAYRDVACEAHRLGVFCYMHCCGNYNPLLPLVPLTGIDVMDGIDPTCGMTVHHTKKTLGGRLSIMGGLSCLTMLQGTAQEVYEEARHCIESGKPGGRFILGSGCAVPRFTPPENIDAARRAVDDWGRYG
jgi:hypothetical protein